MKVCPRCRKPPADPLLIECPTCHKVFVDDTDEPLRLSDEDMDRLAARMAKSLKQDEDLDRIAAKVRDGFRKDDWRSLAKEVIRSLHIVHDVELIAKTLVGIPQFWLLLIATISAALFLIWEAAGHKATEEAQKLFHAEVTNQIRLQFEEPRISNVVVSVATSQARDLLSARVEPALGQFNTALNQNSQAVVMIISNFDMTLATARSNTVALKQVSDFNLLVLRAQADDWPAFQEVIRISEDRKNPMWKVALETLKSLTVEIPIRENILSGLDLSRGVWVGATNTAATASLDDYMRMFSDGHLDNIALLGLMNDFYAQERFPLSQRLEFLAGIIDHNTNISLVSHACWLMDKEAKLGKNIMGSREYLDWYRDGVKRGAFDRNAATNSTTVSFPGVR